MITTQIFFLEHSERVGAEEDESSSAQSILVWGVLLQGENENILGSVRNIRRSQQRETNNPIHYRTLCLEGRISGARFVVETTGNVLKLPENCFPIKKSSRNLKTNF